MASDLSPETCQNNFEQGVAMSLHLWPALSLAVQNNWGGPDSQDKRDWFGGAVVELFPDLAKAPRQAPNPGAAPVPYFGDSDAEPEQVDVERRLLEIMEDEFEVVVDDDTALEVAEQVMRLWAECVKGQTAELDALRRRWEAGKGKKVVAHEVPGARHNDDADWDTEDDDEDEDDDDDGGDDGDGEENGDGTDSNRVDVEMDEAPALVPAKKEKAAPEIDEDGFETVTRKKR